jgi:nitrate reductase NapA
VQVNNPFQHHPNANHWMMAARKGDNFIVVSDAYPSITAKVADLILPAAMIFEKWGAYGNAERRTQAWRQQVLPPGEARADIWHMLEFAKRFKPQGCLGRAESAGLKAEGYPRTASCPACWVKRASMATGRKPRCTRCCSPTPRQEAQVARPHRQGPRQPCGRPAGRWLVPEKAMFEEYRTFGSGNGNDLAPTTSITTTTCAA